MNKPLPPLINNEIIHIDDEGTSSIERQRRSAHSTTNDEFPKFSSRQLQVGDLCNLNVSVSKTKKSRHLVSHPSSQAQTTLSKKVRASITSLSAGSQSLVHSYEHDDDNVPSSSKQKITSFNVLYYESYDPKGPAFESQLCNLKFSCTFGDCQMILSNNVSFMFHLWAHLSEFNYSTTGFFKEREMDQFCRCPQCLHIFPTPYQLQVHFGNVHGSNPSASVCRICEITVEEREHWKIHRNVDVPFHCKKCRYRTSIRTHFIDHFVRFHSNTRTLLCPFCLAHFHIRNTKWSVVRENTYIEHFFKHQQDNYCCDQCSLKFIEYSDKLAHKKDHIKPSSKWVTRIAQQHTRRKGRFVRENLPERHCIECNESLDDVLAHFKSRYNCPHCRYETYCEKAYHTHISIDCRVKRKGLNSNQLLKEVIICDNCKRASCNGDDILNHIRECSGGSCTVVTLKQEKETIFSQLNDNLEVS
ncbi:unnamed protein product [Thelazia callipaeda]|uniref:C2H2-type domain-containing protein n=1 Tax=Thelazia callipaeda TaxID=103827 RepID=A0A0N5D9A6_THECL|nr:unnamed protein product [Thelazia callipaeda]